MSVLPQDLLARMGSSPKLIKGLFVLVLLLAVFGELRSVLDSGNCLDANSVVDKPVSKRTAVSPSTRMHSIGPGELPGYTGWARPEKTLARYFSITSVSTDEAATTTSGYEYGVVVECRGHEDCVVVDQKPKKSPIPSNTGENNDSDACSSWFFLRAYGPSVVPGTVSSRYAKSGSTADTTTSSCRYEFKFLFYDPGVYTIEAVLTFSKPPPIFAFPLRNENEPNYEGYLLPGFPLTTNVVFVEGGGNIDVASKDLCKFEDLVETSPTSAMNKARWKVIGRVNERDYWSKSMNSTVVSTRGYVTNVNSLGISMDYQYLNNCFLMDESALESKHRQDGPALSMGGECSGSQEKIHIVYIGDSVLRVQKDMLQQFLKGIPKSKIEFTYLSLHGGYRKNQAMGPANVQEFLGDLQTRAENDKVVLLFNTGLHDIHRLCGDEFRAERPSYLNRDQLESGSFACVNEYRALLKDFLELVKNFPASLKVFQSTTAAWPKYGNYGIEWGQNGQGMVLVSDFCQAFNEIAFEILQSYRNEIVIMDGYWITYPRPDNREVGDIGKKLSHPGVEVLSAMTRKWIMLILNRVCLPI